MSYYSENIDSMWNRPFYVVGTDEFKEGLSDCHFSCSLENPEHRELLRSINARLIFILAALESGKIIQAFKMLGLLHGVLPYPQIVDFLNASPQRSARIRSEVKRLRESGLIDGLC